MTASDAVGVISVEFDCENVREYDPSTVEVFVMLVVSRLVAVATVLVGDALLVMLRVAVTDVLLLNVADAECEVLTLSVAVLRIVEVAVGSLDGETVATSDAVALWIWLLVKEAVPVTDRL